MSSAEPRTIRLGPDLAHLVTICRDLRLGEHRRVGAGRTARWVWFVSESELAQLEAEAARRRRAKRKVAAPAVARLRPPKATGRKLAAAEEEARGLLADEAAHIREPRERRSAHVVWRRVLIAAGLPRETPMPAGLGEPSDVRDAVEEFAVSRTGSGEGRR